MLVGLPTSGKSTFVNEWYNNAIATNNRSVIDTIILSTDYYIDYYAKQQNKTYNEVFSEYVKEAHRQMDISLSLAIENNKNIIWDQTNLSVKSRRSKLAKIPDTYTKRAAYFPITLEEALRRNQTRPGKVIPEYVIESMHKTIEPPTLEEGFVHVEVYHAKA
jgi:predicted kinase